MKRLKHAQDTGSHAGQPTPLLPLLHGIVRISIYAIILTRRRGYSMVRWAIQFNEVRRIGLWNGDHPPM